MKIQSIIFNKKYWNKKTSKKWLISKKYNTSLGPTIYNFDSPNNWRWRQLEPNFKKYYMKKGDEKGIQYIIGY